MRIVSKQDIAKENLVFVVGPLRKQELKSRKKVHAIKKRRTVESRVYRQKEPSFVRYKPEVIAIGKIKKTKSSTESIEKR